METDLRCLAKLSMVEMGGVNCTRTRIHDLLVEVNMHGSCGHF